MLLRAMGRGKAAAAGAATPAAPSGAVPAGSASSAAPGRIVGGDKLNRITKKIQNLERKIKGGNFNDDDVNQLEHYKKKHELAWGAI